MPEVADSSLFRSSVTRPSTALSLGAALALAAHPLVVTGALAQPAVPASAVRAINLARTTAIAQNGGLSVYRPAQCMFQTANVDNPCMIGSPDTNNNDRARDNRNSNSDPDAYVFRFQGGSPGWQQYNQRPDLETEISISADGRRVLQIHYNGKTR